MSSCYIIGRVSTAKQDVNDNFNSSIDTQISICTNFANNANLNVKKVIREICSAREISNQKQLLQLIKNIKRVYHSTTRVYVLFKDVSRLSRDVTGIAKIFESLRDYNLVFYSVTEGLSYSTNDKLNYGNNDFIKKLTDAKNESDVISKRVKDSLNTRISKGFVPGRIPYGKTQICKSGFYTYKNNTMELKTIEKILKLSHRGDSAAVIANKLNDSGMTHRGGVAFSRASIYNIIRKNNKMSMKTLATSLNAV